MKFRIGLTLVLLLLNIFLFPYILKLPINIKNNSTHAWYQTIIDNPFSGPAILFREPLIRQTWYWIQPTIGAALIGIFFNTNLKGRSQDNEMGGPEAAGQGQFGTARWQTPKEIDNNFTVWEVPNDK